MNVGGKPKRLVLHFDVNKTIVMKDQLNGHNTVLGTICNIIADICWGKLVAKKVGDKEEIQWVLGYDQLSERRPTPLPAEGEPEEELISYKEYLDKFFPLKQKHEVPDDQEREKLNLENESIRNTKLINFAKPSNPGAKFKAHFEKMVKTLSLPKAAKEDLGITDEAGQQAFQQISSEGDLGKGTNNGTSSQEIIGQRKESTQMSQSVLDGGDETHRTSKKREEEKGNDEVKTLMALFGEGKYHLIPSFFRTLIYLKKAKKEFAVVFRTFGNELSNVVFEFNKFCNGDHPCYSGKGGTPQVKFEGSKGTKDLRIKDNTQKGLYYRYGEDVNQSKLVMGTFKRTSKQDPIEDFYSGEIEEGSVNIHSDLIDQYVSVMEILKKRQTLAIQDDYQQWTNSSFMKDGGKVLLVDQADYGTQHIFFDDEALEENNCDINVRDVVSGETLSYRKFIDKYVVKVEPHRAILEPDYFIKLIETAEQKRDEEIERIEQGLDSDDEGHRLNDQENEWEKLQNLSNEEYLMKTVLPVLYQGMKVVDLERPEAPLEYLALYLLKHQDQIKLPPKPQQKI